MMVFAPFRYPAYAGTSTNPFLYDPGPTRVSLEDDRFVRQCEREAFWRKFVKRGQREPTFTDRQVKPRPEFHARSNPG